LTGAYLSGKKYIAVPQKVRTPSGFMTLKNASKHNLKNLTVPFPLGVLCGVSGVSGSGKSTLVMNELVVAIQHEFSGNFKRVRKNNNDKSSKLHGADCLENLVVID